MSTAVLNRSIWDFITGRSTRYIYERVLRRVRAGRKIRFPFRCDSPDCRRSMEMTVVAVEDQDVEFRTRVLSQQSRPPQTLLQRNASPSDGFLRVCDWCADVDLDGDWIEVEEAVFRLRLSERPSPSNILYGVCKACCAKMDITLSTPRMDQKLVRRRGPLSEYASLHRFDNIEKTKDSWDARNLNVLADPNIPGTWVKPGTYLMGSPDSEEDLSRGESSHQVTLTKQFFLSEAPCTQAQWEAVMGTNPSDFKGADRPVEMVSWDEAVDFCWRLTEQQRKQGALLEGWAWRLPTEAEWEYAARAGTTGPRHGELDAIAWHAGNFGVGTHPVKQKAPNAWGLYDMIGNVWEWCSDWYGGYPTGAVIDPKGPSSGSTRASRGGSWCLDGGRCRSAYRLGFDPSARGISLGFRPVLSPVSSGEEMQSADGFGGLTQMRSNFLTSAPSTYHESQGCFAAIPTHSPCLRALGTGSVGQGDPAVCGSY